MARWFVYGKPTHIEQTVVLRGRVRSYRIKPVLEVEGHKLNADPHNAAVIVRLRDTRQWAEVDCRQLTDARDMSAVLRRGAGVIVEPALTLPLPVLTDVLGTWARVTVWMLAFLQLHLEGNGIAIHNYSMAQFEASDADAPAAPDQPRIHSVQLKGQHVGSHRDACQRIVDGGRLLAVELVLTFIPNQTDSFQIPVRIGIANDCATVETAAGKRIPATASAKLHRELVDRVRRALGLGLDPTRLDELVDKIISRAQESRFTAHADMFAPDLKIMPSDGAAEGGTEAGCTSPADSGGRGS